MPKKSVKGAGRIRRVAKKTVWERGEHYAEMWGVEGALSAGIAALDLLDSAGREKAIMIAKGLNGADKVAKPGARPGVADAVDAVKYASVHYELLSKADREALDELRLILGPKPKKPPRSPTRKAVRAVAARARGRSKSGGDNSAGAA